MSENRTNMSLFIGPIILLAVLAILGLFGLVPWHLSNFQYGCGLVCCIAAFLLLPLLEEGSPQVSSTVVKTEATDVPTPSETVNNQN